MKRFLYAAILVGVHLALAVLCLATSPVPAGVHPIVDAGNSLLFGGTINGKWTGEDVMMRKIRGGESYRLYAFGKYLGTGVGGQAEKGDAGGNSAHLTITPSANAHMDNRCTIGICAEWNALPRVPREENIHQQAYVNAVHDLLTSKGLADAPVNITRIVRVDLDGDGADAVLISATTPRNGYAGSSPEGGYGPHKGDYSFVMLRQLVKGTVKTTVLDGEFYPTAKDLPSEANRYTIDAVLDVNGDGVMEVIVGYHCLASGRRIIEITGNKARTVLSADLDV